MDNTSKAKVGYSVWDMLSSALGAAEPDKVQVNSTEYVELLNSIRTKISEAHANTLNSVLTNPNAQNILKPIILNYITDYVNTTNDLSISIDHTAERIYQDMAGFGILTPYLNDPTVEEININAWNSIEVMWADRVELLKETFSSPQECVDIVKKMVRIGGVHIDYSQPIIDSYIGDGTRISATLPPVNTDQVGATASIRKQTFKKVTREQYIQMGFATELVFDLIDMFVLKDVSVGIAGSPGAGKTTFTTCLLRRFEELKMGNNRAVVIEEAREMDITEVEEFNPYGGKPRMTTRALQWSTTKGTNPITARQLIRQSLRVSPGIIVPAEMRGGEAMEAAEAGQTGVQIISTFHAWGARDGYLRVLSMCQMGGNSAGEQTIMGQVIKAFPIMVYIKKDDDGVRRVHEIFEATGVDPNGAVIGNTLFRFVRRKIVENTDGRILKIHGEFVQCGSISKSMRYYLIQHGAKKSVVDQYYFDETDPRAQLHGDYEDSELDVEVEVVEDLDETRPAPPAPPAEPAPIRQAPEEPIQTPSEPHFAAEDTVPSEPENAPQEDAEQAERDPDVLGFANSRPEQKTSGFWGAFKGR